MKAKRTLLILAVLALFLSGGALAALWPLSFADVSGQELRIYSISDDVTVENFAAFPTGDVSSVTLAPTDAGYQAVLASLCAARFTRCLHTLTADYFPENDSAGLLLLDGEGNSVCLCENSAHVMVNGVMYRQSASFDLYQVCQNAIPADGT